MPSVQGLKVEPPSLSLNEAVTSHKTLPALSCEASSGIAMLVNGMRSSTAMNVPSGPALLSMRETLSDSVTRTALVIGIWVSRRSAVMSIVPVVSSKRAELEPAALAWHKTLELRRTGTANTPWVLATAEVCAA